MIREATEKDLEEIINITHTIIKDMKKECNPQWHEGYPTKEDFRIDLNNDSLYVYENKKVIGFAAILEDDGTDYDEVKVSKNEKAYVVHRLGVDKNYRGQGIAYQFMKYAEDLAKKNNVYLMKADTEIKNVPMNGLLKKLGYQKLDTFHWSDNDGTFNYYEKKLK